jgi:hypothetical protein
MAKVKTNPIVDSIRGQIGDLVFRKYGERTTISRKPDFSDRQPTEAQLHHWDRFRQAIVYGKTALADEETEALYEDRAKKKGVPVFSVTTADFFNAPSVDEVDVSAYAGRAGDTIIIQAHDDFEVAGVSVDITDANGQVFESGDASETPAKSGRWQYTATADVPIGTAVRIAVTAKDRPGHKGELTQEKTL